MIDQRHKLDVVPGGAVTVVHVKQYQTDAAIEFELYSRLSGLTLPSSGVTATVRGTKTDGAGYSATATYSASSGTVTVDLDEQMTAVAGRHPFELTLTDTNGVMITATYWLDVQRAALDADTVESESVIREVESVVQDYLEDHPGLFVVDDTLTQTGQAADAKVTGDELTDLKSQIEHLNVETDTTLSVSGKPADSKAVGDALRTIDVDTQIAAYAAEHHLTGVTPEEVFEMVEDVLDNGVAEATIEDWLDNHPEATTTVQDSSIERVKLADSLKKDIGLTADTSYYGNKSQTEGTTTFREMFQKVKNEVMTYCKGDFDKIPILVHTDHHNALNNSASVKAVFDAVDELVNWMDISKVINLGDVTNAWIDADPTNPFVTSTELENACATVKSIPLDHQINVIGNHDVFTWENNTYGYIQANRSYLNPYFRNKPGHRRSNTGWFTVNDDYFNVKYIVLSPYEGTDTSLKSAKSVTSEQIAFLVEELERNDGYDIVILCHEPLNPAYESRVFPTTSDMVWKVSAENDNHWGMEFSLNALLSARVGKTSGIFVDGNNEVHEYDFTNCNTRLLCTLHGHTHYATYNYINDAVLVNSYSAFTQGTHWLFFDVIDRANNVLKVWKMPTAGVDSFTYEKYEIPLTVSDRVDYTIRSRTNNTILFNVSRKIKHGLQYSQYIRPKSGKTIGTVRVTMGETDVTEQYYDSSTKLIHIPSVTGNIVLEAYDTTTDETKTYYYLAVDFDEGVRSMSSSGGSVNASNVAGTTVSFWPTFNDGYRLNEFKAYDGDMNDITATLSPILLSGRLNNFTIDDDYSFSLATAPYSNTAGIMDIYGDITADTTGHCRITQFESVGEAVAVRFVSNYYSQGTMVAEYDAQKNFIRATLITVGRNANYTNDRIVPLSSRTQFVRYANYNSNNAMTVYSLEKFDTIASGYDWIVDFAETDMDNLTISAPRGVIIPSCETVTQGLKQKDTFMTLDINGSNGIPANAFMGCYFFANLILRSDSLVSLGNISAFTNTPFRGYNSRRGVLYVPSALVADYKTATNWADIYNAGYMDILPIEGSGYDTGYKFGPND